ncbi:MAG TPA: ArsA-related P-loop ATPase, partial [Candidatus Limnocylindria bacterium]|nr:ArsA-related P-loop ATPase [Candidatus Limnocylindria bacterium]
VASKRVVLCVGSGGVGKTTTAAALAVGAARRGRRTAVLTVDPSLRLRDALGLGHLDGRPRRVPLGPGAELDAQLLDVKRSFDDLVRALAGDPAHVQRILGNRLYQNLSGTLAGSAEYMAVESVFRLVEEDRYDLVVVDTPPARHAVDFLDAPRRLLAFLDSRALAVLKDPTSILPAATSRLAHMVLASVLSGLERFTGVGLVRELSEFVAAIEGLTGALRGRVAQVAALLASEATELVLVTTPEARLTADTGDLVRSLGERGLRIGGVIVNRALPQDLFGPDAADPGPPAGASAALAAKLTQAFADVRRDAARQHATLAPLLAAAGAPALAEVPPLAAPPVTVAGLEELAALLFAPPGREQAHAAGSSGRA